MRGHPARRIGGGALLAVLARPVLWSEAVSAARRMAPTGWWRSWPPLPVPPDAYLRFRQQTHAGGDGSGALAAHDLVVFLKWCRSNRNALG